MKKTLILDANAKINLSLWVKERRPDGFHEISSIMQSISLCDTLTFRETKEEGIFIDCDNPSIPKGPENLAHLAAKIILNFFGIPPAIFIKIQKRIPIAAGLGGGSSDAAAVMVGLLRMYDKSMPIIDLMNLAQKVGSDVPFLIHGGLALATGRGEVLTFYDTPKPPFFVLIAIPKGLEVSTKWAYENFTPGENTRKAEIFPELLPAFKRRNLEFLSERVFNDLESVTMQRHPELKQIKEALLSVGKGVVLMSGSGPAVFGIFEEKRTAIRAASNLDPQKVDIFLEHTVKVAGR